MIKIILIEDHALVRASLCRLLSSSEDIEVIGEATTGTEGLELVKMLRPDMVLLDFRLPDIDGLELTPQLLTLNEDLKILVVSATANDVLPLKFLKAGVKGYITKGSDQKEFINAIKAINNNQIVLGSIITKQLANSPLTGTSKTILDLLSTREQQVMMLLVKGVSINEIAEELKVNSKTIHSYRTRIFSKLNIDSDVKLLFSALRHGLIKLDPDSNEYVTVIFEHNER